MTSSVRHEDRNASGPNAGERRYLSPIRPRHSNTNTNMRRRISQQRQGSHSPPPTVASPSLVQGHDSQTHELAKWIMQRDEERERKQKSSNQSHESLEKATKRRELMRSPTVIQAIEQQRREQQHEVELEKKLFDQVQPHVEEEEQSDSKPNQDKESVEALVPFLDTSQTSTEETEEREDEDNNHSDNLEEEIVEQPLETKIEDSTKEPLIKPEPLEPINSVEDENASIMDDSFHVSESVPLVRSPKIHTMVIPLSKPASSAVSYPRIKTMAWLLSSFLLFLLFPLGFMMYLRQQGSAFMPQFRSQGLDQYAIELKGMIHTLTIGSIMSMATDVISFGLKSCFACLHSGFDQLTQGIANSMLKAVISIGILSPPPLLNNRAIQDSITQGLVAVEKMVEDHTRLQELVMDWMRQQEMWVLKELQKLKTQRTKHMMMIDRMTSETTSKSLDDVTEIKELVAQQVRLAVEELSNEWKARMEYEDEALSQMVRDEARIEAHHRSELQRIKNQASRTLEAQREVLRKSNKIQIVRNIEEDLQEEKKMKEAELKEAAERATVRMHQALMEMNIVTEEMVESRKQELDKEVEMAAAAMEEVVVLATHDIANEEAQVVEGLIDAIVAQEKAMENERELAAQAIEHVVEEELAALEVERRQVELSMDALNVAQDEIQEHGATLQKHVVDEIMAASKASLQQTLQETVKEIVAVEEAQVEVLEAQMKDVVGEVRVDAVLDVEELERAKDVVDHVIWNEVVEIVELVDSMEKEGEYAMDEIVEKDVNELKKVKHEIELHMQQTIEQLSRQPVSGDKWITESVQGDRMAQLKSMSGFSLLFIVLAGMTAYGLFQLSHYRMWTRRRRNQSKWHGIRRRSWQQPASSVLSDSEPEEVVYVPPSEDVRSTSSRVEPEPEGTESIHYETRVPTWERDNNSDESQEEDVDAIIRRQRVVSAFPLTQRRRSVVS